MYCPIILGSDKTMVSVATGHVEYHPLYLSIGNPYNTVRCAHCNAVIPIVFLAIPKCMSLLPYFHLRNNLNWIKNMCTIQMIVATMKVLLFKSSSDNYIICLWPQFYAHSFQGWLPLLSTDVWMATSVGWFTISWPSLPITLSKSCSPVSFKAGAPSEHSQLNFLGYTELGCHCQMHCISG